MGGRIETHFHVFGSLAFLAFYREWTLLIAATVVIAVDHAMRGIVWPQTVFGVLTAAPWRSLQHATWVLFEEVFLIYFCRKVTFEMQQLARHPTRRPHPAPRRSGRYPCLLRKSR